MNKIKEILNNTTRCTIDEEADLDIIENFYFKYEDVVFVMQEYGKQQYNQAIKDASENCTTELTSTCIRVDKDSILKLLKP